MADASKPVICSALAPVPPGQRRFRVRGLIDGKRQPVLYVLAASEADAKAAYVEELKLSPAGLEFVVGVTPN